MKYTNPVVPGFHPDPSACRVGDDFYLVTSSFECFPAVPLVHSGDLVHWRLINHCLSRPSRSFDADGAVHFFHASHGIVQREILLPSGTAGKERPIWGGTGGQYPEGPFEPCPRNPILSHLSIASPVQATGHGDFIQDSSGNWWVVFLGIRPNGHWPCHHLGRETFLASVIWDDDGWPVIGDAGRASLEMSDSTPAPHARPVPPKRDDFNRDSLGHEWNSLQYPECRSWSLVERPGWLRLRATAASLDDIASPAWIGRRQEHFDVRAARRLQFDSRSEKECAGMTAWMNERHHHDLFVTVRGGTRCLVVRRRIGILAAEVARHTVGLGAVILLVDAGCSVYRSSGAAGSSGATAGSPLRWGEVGSRCPGFSLARAATPTTTGSAPCNRRGPTSTTFSPTTRRSSRSWS